MHSINGSNNNQPQQLQLSADEVDVIECECGCEIFSVGVKQGKLSAVHPKNTTGKTQISTAQVMYCVKCFAEFEGVE